jgi:hypothetical protein
MDQFYKSNGQSHGNVVTQICTGGSGTQTVIIGGKPKEMSLADLKELLRLQCQSYLAQTIDKISAHGLVVKAIVPVYEFHPKTGHCVENFEIQYAERTGK